MNATIRNRLRAAAVTPHLSKLRPELRTPEIASYLGARVEIDSETGEPTTDVAALVSGWAAENGASRAADAPAAKPAAGATPAREIPASGRDALRVAVVQALMSQAHPAKSGNGGP